MLRFLLPLLLAGMLAGPSVASARRSDVYAYRYEQAWSTVIRLLRVDYGFPVRDRDREIGYLLFDYLDHGRPHQGSIELVRLPGQRGYEEVRVTLNIPEMPSYIERMLQERFERKLREDHGSPLQRPRPIERPEPEPEEEDETSEEESPS